jgi:hypothetical protein
VSAVLGGLGGALLAYVIWHARKVCGPPSRPVKLIV